jgi:hypothetical protein
MNLVTFIDGVHIFFRNFGLRHANAAFGEFVVELSAQNGFRKIVALFARRDDRLRARLCGEIPADSIEPQIKKPREVCLAEVSFR